MEKLHNTNSLLPQLIEPRNVGLPLDLDWVMRATANTSAIERRCATLPGRRSVKKDYQAAWLCRAISCIDLTTLSGDDTAGRVRRLATKARQPVRADLLQALGMDGLTVDGGDWWFNLRPSNTEPLLRLNLEAPDRARCDERVAEVQAHMAA